ncbi:MAG TPA: hypothetical protein VGC68_02075, partial [Enterovirga sp.]
MTGGEHEAAKAEGDGVSADRMRELERRLGELERLLGSRAAEPAHPASAEGGRRPRILFLGAEPRAIGLIELYGLGGHPDFALTD